jgi:secreted trypsin-like serine protease
VLLKTRVPGKELQACADKYRPHNVILVRSQLCAGGSALRQDSCKGDSGGPLKMFVGARMFQVGVVSFGTSKCATEGYPGVYTRVGRYMKWILDTIKP